MDYLRTRNVFLQIYILFSSLHLCRLSILLRSSSLNGSREFVAFVPYPATSKKMAVSVHCSFSHRYRASIALPEQARRRMKIGRSFPDSFSSPRFPLSRTRILLSLFTFSSSSKIVLHRCSLHFI